MVTRREALGVLGAVMLLSGCGYRLPTYRYRLTVEVDTPEGLRAGSSVIEVENWTETSLNGGGLGSHHKGRGEAVAVDLPGGQTLFALLRSEDGDVDWPLRVVPQLVIPPRPADGEDSWGPQVRAASARTGLVTLPRKFAYYNNGRSPAYPLLVRFHDIQSPASVEAVDPDDLVSGFGPGVKLKRITVQITDDPVTTGIEKRFVWWTQFRDRHFDGTETISESMTGKALAGHLSSGSFTTEFNQNNLK